MTGNPRDTRSQPVRCENRGCSRVAEWHLEVMADGFRQRQPLTLFVCDQHLYDLAKGRPKVVG